VNLLSRCHIHFTGADNPASVLGSDDTTVLIDRGATPRGPPASAALRPNDIAGDREVWTGSGNITSNAG